MHLTPPAPTGPPDAVLPLAVLFIAISLQYLVSYYLGRRALVVLTLLLVSAIAWSGVQSVSWAIEVGRNPRLPGDDLAPITAFWITVLCTAAGIILTISAAIMSWHHGKNL